MLTYLGLFPLGKNSSGKGIGIKMNFRLASQEDLPQLKVVFGKIIERMNQENIPIWDEIYPCEYFKEDIENKRLYILEENSEIVSAFALCDSNAGTDDVEWKYKNRKILYLDRLGINVKYARQGFGSIMLAKAMKTAKEKGAQCLRLFVVDNNQPAINLYLKNGFQRAEGIYHEVIDETLTLQEYGFEKSI